MIELAEVLCVFSQLAIGGCPPPRASAGSLESQKKAPSKAPFLGPNALGIHGRGPEEGQGRPPAQPQQHRDDAGPGRLPADR